MYAESAPGRKVFFLPLQRGDRGAGAFSVASFLRVEVFLLVAWMETGTGRAEGSLYFHKLQAVLQVSLGTNIDNIVSSLFGTAKTEVQSPILVAVNVSIFRRKYRLCH